MSSQVMAAVIEQPRHAQLRPVPPPSPKPSEVRIALEGTGVCASNLPLYQGAPWFSYPLAPGQGGHEGWGRVVEVGADVDKRWIGKRVAALSYAAYAEQDVASVNDIAEIPEALADQPCPGEALGCAMNILERAQIERGQTVAIVGIGFLGALLTRLARERGAEVIAISRRGSALSVARVMGANAVVPLTTKEEVLDEVRCLTSGRLCDRVIEATGKAEPLDVASELAREYARLLIAGYHQDGPRQVNMQLWNYRALDVINAHERDPRIALRGMRAAIAAIEEGWLDPTPLYTHRFPLSQLGDAFETLLARPDGFMKALIETGAQH